MTSDTFIGIPFNGYLTAASDGGALHNGDELVALLTNVRSVDAICCEIAYKLVKGGVRPPPLISASIKLRA